MDEERPYCVHSNKYCDLCKQKKHENPNNALNEMSIVGKKNIASCSVPRTWNGNKEKPRTIAGSWEVQAVADQSVDWVLGALITAHEGSYQN